MKKIAYRYLSFLPIPALIAILTAFHFLIKPSFFFEPSWLLPIANTIFVTLVFFIVAYIAMRNYMATGRIQILLLGCGVLAFGIGGAVAGLVRSIPGAGANLNVTIYNTGALIAAIFHFVAAIILLIGISPEIGVERKGFWLVFGYLGLAVSAGLFTMASFWGLVPPFFVQGVGPTTLRQAVLGTADILFAFSFLIFMGTYLRNGEVFLYWYSSALALTSISLSAFFIQSAVGSPIGWAGRFSQYLGGVYFLIAILTAIRSAQARRISFDSVLSASLSPGEEKFRALAENSPDIIVRFDRGMRYTYVNRTGLEFFGKPAAKMIGLTVERAGLPEPYRSLWRERIQKVFETAQAMEVEDYFPTGTGVGFYQSHCVPEYDVDGTVANVLVVSRDLTDRKSVEENLRERTLELQQITETLEGRVKERTRELEEANEALRHLSLKILSAQEEERKLLSREIHDSLGSSLAAIKFRLEEKLVSMQKDPPEKMITLEQIVEMVKETIKEGRRISSNLRPSILDNMGILSTVTWFCEQHKSFHPGLKIETCMDIQEEEVSEQLKIVIFRILQEGLHNIVKHAKADTVRVELAKWENDLRLTIEDDGVGFSLEKINSQSAAAKGLGLTSMRERAGLSGGSFIIESEEGKGTTIRTSWPIPVDDKP